MTSRKLTLRQEANALTALAFRNGFLEDLHAGRESALLSDPELSRISNAEMKTLMVEASAKLSELLLLKENEPEEYRRQILFAFECYAKSWDTVTDSKSARKLRRKGNGGES